MITLSNLSPQDRSTKQRKRVGRGPGSGHGKTAGRGHKGYKARSGSGVKPGFEGGQMPLYRRLPKRGFTNTFKQIYEILSLSQLDKFDAGSEVNKEKLVECGLVAKDAKIKVLANGIITKSITVHVHKISAKAKALIEAAGGNVVIFDNI